MSERQRPETAFNLREDQYAATPDAGTPNRKRSSQGPRRIGLSRGGKRAATAAGTIAATAVLAFGSNGEATPDVEHPYGATNPDVTKNDVREAMDRAETDRAGQDHLLDEGVEVDPNDPS